MTVAQLSRQGSQVMRAPAALPGLRRQLEQALEVHTGFLAGSGLEVDDGVQLALARLAERSIGEIQAAIERLDQGTYGTCESCSLPIPPDRLQAIPYARCCSACAVTQPSR